MDFLPKIEQEPIDIIKKYQDERLIKNLEYINAKSDYYRNVFSKNKIDIKKIKSVEDLKHIPVTNKEDLQLYNKDFICVDSSKIVDYITTSGTLSTPTTFAMTDKDLDRLAYNEAISFICAGGSQSDIYQLMTTIDKRFMAGLAYFLGIRMMGAGIIRVGNGMPELQWDTIQRISPTSIICVPSFILKVIKYAEEHNIDYKNSSIKKAICIGENLRNDDFSLNLLGSKIKEKWNIDLYSTYASTEMGTSFCECQEGKGGHHHPELIICELLDENGNIVPEGEFGELTITTLGVEGMPLLRFKTGDIARFHYEPCKCGRTTIRISPIIGRKNQMIKYKGTTLYPAAIFDILDNIDFIENYVVIVSENELGTDELTIRIGCHIHDNNTIKEVKDFFRAKIRVAPEIIIDSIENIRKLQDPENNRKPRKFINNKKS
ncbi:AMP-binding protein [Odoribacter sp. OttesenSCG-928-L07]|nr:AMP-binding protein [Odoribacter sp. OttesenSCG-928-L07]MDL2238889.1 AMP-binding protein [Bacteroidales bacterium OttesenSCG-928-L14]MDL2240629.1 AMP-binding protein [Bacteroidales bacterium OttesenSCG-928-K22]